MKKRKNLYVLGICFIVATLQIGCGGSATSDQFVMTEEAAAEAPMEEIYYESNSMVTGAGSDELKEMENMDCKAELIFGDKRLNAKSQISIISAGIKKGSEVTFECDGDEEEKALAKLVEMASNGFKA